MRRQPSRTSTRHGLSRLARHSGLLSAAVLLLVLVVAACTGAGGAGSTAVPSAPGGGGADGGPGSIAVPSAPGGVATPDDAADGTQAPILLSRFAVDPPPGWEGDTISLGELPPEARDTLLLVASGGPFPYDQDDATFQNREAILPDQPVGYYAEYTVETPGSADRGARRLVVGGERYVYYTADHYDTFSLVRP